MLFGSVLLSAAIFLGPVTITAVSVAGAWLSIGFGSAWIEPATTFGPAASPPVRWMANVALL